MPTTMNPRHAENMLLKAIRLQRFLQDHGTPELAEVLTEMAAASSSDENRESAAYLRKTIARLADEHTPYSPATVAQAALLIKGAASQPLDPFEGLG